MQKGFNGFHIAALLRRGRENAIQSKQLARMAGYSSVRALQQAIHAERTHGALIMSDKSGFYLPRDAHDVERFTKSMKRRAFSIFSAIQTAQQAIQRYNSGYKQMTLSDWVREFEQEAES